MAIAPDRYRDRLLELYRHTPGTCGHIRHADRHLAATLEASGVSLQTVQAALLLGVARREFRPASALPLARIASLHYFLPIIDEILALPPDAAYLDYLCRRLATLAPLLVRPIDHQIS